MRTLLNLIWVVLGGFWLWLGYIFFGVIACIFIVTIPAGVASFDDLMTAAAPLPGGHPLPSADEVAVLLYTGGTTGTPKAVALTHANARSNAEMSLVWASQTCEVGQETFYAVLPFFHAFGLSLSLLCAVGMAATQVVLPKFGADMVLAAWKRRPATFFPGVPVMFDRIVTRALATGVDLSSCKIAVCGAAANPRTVAESWEKATGGVIIEGYGMTETSPIVLGNPISPERRAGALGVPYPSTDVRVIDPDDPDRDVAPGQIGELIVRGPQVFTGYWENPEETEAVMLPGGWLRTGDLVRQEEDGFYVIADRRKELIINGGFNVYPSQVEEAIKGMPGVRDVAVVGMPEDSRDSRGESVVAALVLEPGAAVDLDAVRRWTQDKLSHYAMPRSIAVVADLPRSQLGKVLRRSVREQLQGFELKAGQWRAKASELTGATGEAFEAFVSRLQEQYSVTREQLSDWLASKGESLEGLRSRFAERTPSPDSVRAWFAENFSIEGLKAWLSSKTQQNSPDKGNRIGPDAGGQPA